MRPEERRILQALEDLPPAAVEQVKDFIAFLRTRKGMLRPLEVEKEVARKQTLAIKKWTGANLGQGFSGREHDAVLYRSAL